MPVHRSLVTNAPVGLLTPVVALFICAVMLFGCGRSDKETYEAYVHDTGGALRDFCDADAKLAKARKEAKAGDEARTEVALAHAMLACTDGASAVTKLVLPSMDDYLDHLPKLPGVKSGYQSYDDVHAVSKAANEFDKAMSACGKSGRLGDTMCMVSVCADEWDAVHNAVATLSQNAKKAGATLPAPDSN
jgi:hypothetical protein